MAYVKRGISPLRSQRQIIHRRKQLAGRLKRQADIFAGIAAAAFINNEITMPERSRLNSIVASMKNLSAFISREE